MSRLRWIGLALVTLLGLAIISPPVAAQLSPIARAVYFAGGSQWVSDGTNTVALRNGTNAQVVNLYNTYTNATNYEKAVLSWSGNVWTIGTQHAGTGSARALALDGDNGVTFRVGGSSKWQFNTSGHLVVTNDNANDIGASNANRPRSLYLAAPALTVPTQAAGGTLNNSGDVTRLRYQITVAPATGDCATAFNAAALTADCTIATLQAGEKLVGVYADVTVGFTCSGTCSGTKVVQCGTAAGGTQILAAGFNVAATGTAGLADADLGSSMTRAAAIQGGLIGSWSTTTAISCRFTSGTGNWGNGATFVNAGTIKFTLITEQLK